MTTPQGRTPSARVRLATAVPVTAESASGRQLIGRVLTLSTTGLFLASAAPDPAGTALRLTFGLPFTDRSREITATAVVRWVNAPEHPQTPMLPPGMGLQFVHLDAVAREWLDAFLVDASAATRQEG